MKIFGSNHEVLCIKLEVGDESQEKAFSEIYYQIPSPQKDWVYEKYLIVSEAVIIFVLCRNNEIKDSLILLEGIPPHILSKRQNQATQANRTHFSTLIGAEYFMVSY